WEFVWGKSWTEWLPNEVGGVFEARQIHEAKNRAYARVIRDAELTLSGAYELAHEYATNGQPFLVTTCASVAAAEIVLARLGLIPGLMPITLNAGVSAQEKIALINDGDWIHIDDDLTVIQSIRDGIHYVDQSVEELRQSVKELNPWTP